MNLGVLTFHNNENRGAILQAYSLCYILEDFFDANAEIVEYRTQSKESSRKRSILATKKPRTIPDRIHDRRIVEQFFETELPTSEETIVTDDHETAVTWLRELGYDGLVTGSDEVGRVGKSFRTSGAVAETKP